MARLLITEKCGVLIAVLFVYNYATTVHSIISNWLYYWMFDKSKTKPAACMQVKNHLFLRRDDNREAESEQEWHLLSLLFSFYCRRLFCSLRSFMSDLRMEKHECVFLYILIYDLISSILKLVVFSKQKLYVNFLTF